nr:hypothetical protein [Tanacetum cinerariifolium]
MKAVVAIIISSIVLGTNFPLFLPEGLLRNPTWHGRLLVARAVLASPGLLVGFIMVVTRGVVFAITRSFSE